MVKGAEIGITIITRRMHFKYLYIFLDMQIVLRINCTLHKIERMNRGERCTRGSGGGATGKEVWEIK